MVVSGMTQAERHIFKPKYFLQLEPEFTFTTNYFFHYSVYDVTIAYDDRLTTLGIFYSVLQKGT